MTFARIVAAGWLFNLRQLMASRFFVMTATIQPVIFASIAFFLVRAGHRPGTLLYVALGAGIMGVWSTTLFAAGGVIQWQRRHGTLELLVAAPPPFLLVLVSWTLASPAMGLYAILATLVWGRIFFGVPLHVAHPLAFVAALPSLMVALGLLGLVMASTFVLYRNANAFANLLEYPVWLVTGLLVPLSLLPAWVTPLAWTLGPSWGVRAVRAAAIGGSPWPAVGMCLGLATVYLVVGALLLANFERLARRDATLALS
jgi:ABC-2 type transport system permease protein